MGRFFPTNSREWTFLVVGLVLSFIFFSGPSGTDSETPINTSSDSSEPTISESPVSINPEGSEPEAIKSNENEEPLIIFNEGDGQTEPFNLMGGNYEVFYQTYKNCVYYIDLEAIDQTYGTDVFSSDIEEESTNYLYGVPPGQYYLSAITGSSCSWRVTFNPLDN